MTRIPFRIWRARAPQPQGGRQHLDKDPPQDLQRQRSTPTGGGHIGKDPPQHLERQRRHFDKDPSQDLERQRPTTTGEAAP